METPVKPGFRVIRGPDWTYKNQDGGKGYAGTVLRLHDERQLHFPKLSVLVQWDNGDKGLYRAGYDQGYDLRIIDTANAVCHPKVWCDGCDVDEIRGMRWRCTECYAFDLCTTCYMNGEHDLSHIFMRVLYSDKTSVGPKMLPRSSSPRLALRGSFAGAKVVRHPQWHKRLEPDKLLGTVVRHGQTLEDKANGRAAVEFSSRRERVDFIKILCTLPGSGGFLYAGHLPNLGDLELVNEGDNVLVTATPAELEELHKRRGLWKPDMTKTVRKKGFVNKRTNTGDFTVTFQDSQETFTMNSAALRKIHPLCLGQRVRISDNIEMVKRLQSGHGGWTAAMKKAIGTVGKVVEIDGSEIRVKIKDNQTLIFNSANLAPERIRAPKPENVDSEENLRGIPRAMQDPEWPIMAATEAGDIKEMERILAIHPEWIHYEYEPGCSLLGFIAGTGNVHKVKFLLEKGAFTECIDMNGCTPLFHATYANKYEVVEYLLDQGADVHAVNWQGYTCLYLACAQGFSDCAHYLLMHGADLNQKGEQNMTPVHQSITGGRTVVDLIVDRKEADLKAVSSDLVSSMHQAAGFDKTYAMTKLLDKIPRLVEAMDENGRCPLYSAAFKGCRDAAELLIKKGRCNVNVVDSECGTCPLAAAIFFQNFNIVDILVKHGADINLPNNVGKTSLQFAVDVHATRGQGMKEEPYMAEMKMKWGHLGIKTNSDALLAFLVSHGGDLNAFNRDRVTIKTLLQKNREPILQPLLEIQSQRGKDIARQQSTANRPLRTLTVKTNETGAEANSVSSLLRKSTGRPDSKKQSSGDSSEKFAVESGIQQKSSGDLHHLQAELQRKDEELETLRSRVKTLEHLVKKKISFTCGHNVIRSVAELIPDCPNCSGPISSVLDLQ
ncbi:E3 ubiquitin-protein ligase MIB2-like [Strongylocentrotus purpuratus]|uniref:RING-type E3 ubiquitin transferase n=1 Tax=Strongylocentrotus purpuratus TaxID=7668 RepID=A0A7M7PJU4_STRPU|nr:E3 ubiquitin-protein ligase MIB2-like [Strongylocentrotus purpuratus]